VSALHEVRIGNDDRRRRTFLQRLSRSPKQNEGLTKFNEVENQPPESTEKRVPIANVVLFRSDFVGRLTESQLWEKWDSA